MAKILKIYDPYGSKLLHAFDSFEGLTEFTEEDKVSPESVKGLYKGSYEKLMDFISLYKNQDTDFRSSAVSRGATGFVYNLWDL